MAARSLLLNHVPTQHNKYFSGNSICGLKGDHPFALATPRAAGWGSAQLNQIWKYMMRNICLVNKHSWENEQTM